MRTFVPPHLVPTYDSLRSLTILPPFDCLRGEAFNKAMEQVDALFCDQALQMLLDNQGEFDGGVVRFSSYDFDSSFWFELSEHSVVLVLEKHGEIVRVLPPSAFRRGA